MQFKLGIFFAPTAAHFRKKKKCSRYILHSVVIQTGEIAHAFQMCESFITFIKMCYKWKNSAKRPITRRANERKCMILAILKCFYDV